MALDRLSARRTFLSAGNRGHFYLRLTRVKAGRPTVGAGAQIAPVSIERGLLAEVDAFAERHHLKRSQMVTEGLRLVMQRQAV